MWNFKVLCICPFLFSIVRTLNSLGLDILYPSQSIRDNTNETLVSPNGRFELGFFPLGQLKNRYVGIWYKNIDPLIVVWVANREIPLTDTSGVLELNDRGLVLLDGTNRTIWSSNSSISTASENPIVRLQDSGNLVVKNRHDNIVWQSFDYPTDTLLPEMKLGWNKVTGLDTFLSSWKSEDDPAQGEFVIKIDRTGYPQLILLNGSEIMARAGSWNGVSFTGFPYHDKDSKYTPEFVFDDDGVYFDFKINDNSVLTRYILDPSGTGQRLDWDNQAKNWKRVTAGLQDKCEYYAFCGTYSVCNTSNSPLCECLKGFVPRSPQEWSKGNWSMGCDRKNTLAYNNSDGFRTYTCMKLPNTSSSSANKTMSIEDCREKCRGNSSCTAYATLNIGTGNGCLQWFDDLIDMRVYPCPDLGQELHFKVSASDQDHVADFVPGKPRKKRLVGIVAGSTTTIMGIIILGFYVLKDKREKPGIPKVLMAKSIGMREILHQTHYYDKLKKEGVDLPTFDLSTIAKATDDFSFTNKLGEGGFGPVYKGTLPDGREVAVKRLSKNSTQWLEEFVNEVTAIAKLQHRNLVKLLGCCIQGEEKILIYEYLLNRSLNCLIFDETRSKLLAWPVRLYIIDGIARGLLYLHQDSTLRIIHRDIKTSNILLDVNMNQKISDFGLARILEGDQVEANTEKLVGTYGYISPEFVRDGQFSIKSDVFSFGVIVLEIISGKKNKIFSNPENPNLLEHAWKLWTENRPLELMDKCLRESCSESEVMRCIQLGLLCVQQRPADRPNMSSVVLMLNGEKLLPKPKPPGFYFGREILEEDYSSGRCRLLSANEVSLTILEPR